MARRSEGILLELVELPWWASVIAAAFMYAGFRWLVPLAAGSTQIGVVIGKVASTVAPWIGLLFLLPAPFAVIRAWMDRRLLERARGSQAIRSIPWDEFERLIAVAFGRIGYQVERRGGAGADGGVDLVLREPGKTTLVQCKHWSRQQVGVSIVRELYGVMNSELAEGGVIVTGGSFTADAEAFARGKGIDLINGAKLDTLLSYARGEDGGLPAAAKADAAPPDCPQCGARMVRRTARKGVNAGSDFWGCGTYPGCKGTRPI